MQIIINEIMADDGPVPMDLGNVGAHDAEMTESYSDTSNDMSYDVVCAIAWKRVQSRQGNRRGRTERIRGVASSKRS